MSKKKHKFKPYYINKASGEKEQFNIKKLERSIVHSGASKSFAKEIAEEVSQKKHFNSAKQIHNYVAQKLRHYHKGIAGRYNIKKSLLELGPTGFPFEKFVAEIFKHEDYNIEIDKIEKGVCIKHELDVVLQKEDKYFMVECKFHNVAGIKTDVKVPLYIRARFEDLNQQWLKMPKYINEYHEAFIVTNTKFTYNAVNYAKCVGINLLGWAYPKDHSLEKLIDKFGLHPITALFSLNKKQKKVLINKGLVLCKQIENNQNLLKNLGLNSKKILQVLDEAEKICCLNHN